MSEKSISICLTSCDRFDLLERTVKSLAKHWDYLTPNQFFVHEDSRDFSKLEFDVLEAKINSWIPDHWPRVGLSNQKVGQIKAIDWMYQKVTSDYIFHCEDDWEFDSTGFIWPSVELLNGLPNVSNVWIRYPNDRNKHPVTGGILKMNRIMYQKMSIFYGGGDWPGFSFNPGLRRLSDYKKHFPNGYQEIAEFNPKEPWRAESKIARAYRRKGFFAVTLLRGYVQHIGDGRHVG
jgi:hypothetical protein